MGTRPSGGAGGGSPPRRRRRELRIFLRALLFLTPALILLGALVVYPIFFTAFRSLFDIRGETFVGAQNYRRMFTAPNTLTAIRNNLIWVAVAPMVVTAIGLVFAVLTERIRWSTAFKVVVFMPMAISFLAAGVIFRLVYEQDPDRGLANAMVRSVTDVARPPGAYPNARPSEEEILTLEAGALVSPAPLRPGETVAYGLVGIPPRILPEEAIQARAPPPAPAGAITGVIWLDFSPGGDRGVIDAGERGLPGIRVEARREGRVVAHATTGPDGTFTLEDLGAEPVAVRLPEANFRPPWGGLSWLGPTLVTPATIGAFIWIWAGFAMVLIGAGLSAISREVLEAARVDGANEWQVFRRVTVPLLWPVLLVVLVTLSINVLKIFDLVLIIPPGSVQADATVIALEMWRVSFGGARDQGLGSAMAVFLFLLVLPAMIFNIRRFRMEE